MAASTLDAVILSGLRIARGPVEDGAIPDRIGIRYSTLPGERQASLDRLVALGLVSRRVVRKLHRERPLFDFIEITVYQAIGGEE
jgi:hypothetical protein